MALYHHSDKEEKDIAIAFFDILGSAKRIGNGDYKTVYDFYEHMITLCSVKSILISRSPRMFEVKDLVSSGWPENTDIGMSMTLNHVFFSDTFIIWIEDLEFWGMRLRGFYEKCNEIFVEAIKKRIPLRGAISRGKAIMDNEKRIYLGKPIVESARLEPLQNWIGISLGYSCEILYPSEAACVIPYTEQYKKELLENPNVDEIFVNENRKECVTLGYGDIASLMALNWPRYWRENEKDNLSDIISEMNTDEKFSSYYENAMTFIDFSNKNEMIMKEIEDNAPLLAPKLVRYVNKD